MDESKFEQKFHEIFSTISEMYDKSPSTFLFELWFNSLRRFEIEAIDKAFSVHVQDPDSGQFMPKPADIIRIIEGSTKDSAFGAWTKTRKAIGSVGSYESVVFDDPIIHRVIQDMGGWIRLCSTKEDEIDFIKNEFVNRYQGFKKSGEIPEYPPKLIGIVEGENTAAGFFDHIPEPTLIGDSKKAEQVIRLGSRKPSLEIQRRCKTKKLSVKPELKVLN